MATIEQAIEISKSIQQAIKSYDWTEVERLDEHRLKVIEEYYKTVESIDARQTLKLKEINDQIVSQLAEMQQKTRHSQLGLNKGRIASQTYLDIANK